MGIEQKTHVLAVLESVSRSYGPGEGPYADPRTLEYLAELGNAIGDCGISAQRLSVTLKPGFFAENWKLAKNLFPCMVEDLENRSLVGWSISCGSYKLEFNESPYQIGAILKGGDLVVSVYRGERGPKRTAAEVGREFMELARREGRTFHISAPSTARNKN